MWCRPSKKQWSLLDEKSLEEMTLDEKYELLYIDPITRIHNRRAWDGITKGPARAWIDADGPEDLSDGDCRALCERHLRAIAAALQESMPGDVAYLYGDYFVAHAPTLADLEKGIAKALNTLSTVRTQMTRPDGATILLYGLGFSHWQAYDLPANAAENYDIRGFAQTKAHPFPAGALLPARLRPLFRFGYKLTQVRLTMSDGTIQEC